MRVPSLTRRLGSAALVLTLGVGLAACSDDSGSSDTSSSASDEGNDTADDSTDESTEAPEESEEPAEASLAELSVDDFYPSVMAAMKDAETFAFETTSGSAGQTQTMAGQARFSDAGVEMKAASTGAQAMEMILVGQAMYMKSPDLGTGDKWLKIDLSDPNSLFGMIGKATDPEVMFKAMRRRRRSSSSVPRTSTASRPTTTGSPSTRPSTSTRWTSPPRWPTCSPRRW